ncbi:MAG: hypothetical protein AAB426_04915 [Myxococcota bacterium]
MHSSADTATGSLAVAAAAIIFGLVSCGTSPYGVALDANEPPIADAGWDASSARNTLVEVSGMGLDPEGRPLTYRWRQVSGPAVTLAAPRATTTTFISPDVPGIVRLAFEVADGQSTATAYVEVEIYNRAPSITGVVVTPDPAITTDTLTAAPTGTDPDGDALTATYQWTKNGVAIGSVTGSTLPGSHFVKADVIGVTATLSDGYDQASLATSLTIADAPPIVTSTAPSSTTYGVPMSFQVSASDPDGDAFSYALGAAPSGMSMNAGGLVTWTPAGPMLDTTLDVRWMIEANGSGGAGELRGTILVTDAARERPLVRSGIEAPPAAATLAVADLDADGKTEMLILGREHLLMSLEYDGADYVQDWVYPFRLGSGTLTGVAVGETSGDNRPEIFVATSGDSYGVAGKIVRIDGASRRVDAEVDETPAYLSSLRVVEFAGNATPDIVYLAAASTYGDTTIVVRNAATLAERWRSGVINHGSTLVVGNVDADAAPEIVTSAGYVYDGASHVNEWLYGSGFGEHLDVGDVDGDGIAEVVGSTASGPLRGFDAITKVVDWSFTPSSVGALRVGEIDGTLGAEVLVVDSYTGSLRSYSYSAATLVEDWSIASPDSGPGLLELADVDDDGDLEAVWSLGIDSSGEDSLAVANIIVPRGLSWHNVAPSQLDGPFVGGLWVALGASDTRALFATTSTDSGYAGTRLASVDATGTVRVGGEVSSNWENRVCLAGGDMDADGYAEAYLGTFATYDGLLEVYDVVADTPLWSYGGTFDFNVDVRAVAAVDLNSDGADDLVSLAATGSVRIDSPSDSTLLWSSPAPVAGTGVDLEVADLGTDAEPELVVLTTTTLAVFHRDLGQPALVSYLTPATVALDLAWASAADLAIGNLDDDGSPELVVLASDDSITIYDAGLSLIRTVSTGLDASAVFVDAASAAPRNLLLAAHDPDDGFDYLVAVDAVSGGEIWRSPPLVGAVQQNSLHAADTHGDAALELVFGTTRAMYLTR